jgi:hypothetical protein
MLKIMIKKKLKMIQFMNFENKFDKKLSGLMKKHLVFANFFFF